MSRWLAAAVVLALLPACKPYLRTARRRPAYEDDARGALPVVSASEARQTSSTHVASRTDEFTGDVTHELEFRLGGMDSLDFVGRTGVQTMLVQLHTGSERWRFLECHHVHGLADETRIAPLDVEHDGRVLRRSVAEHVSFMLTIDDLVAMATAERVRFRVCTTVIQLPRTARIAFADLLARIRGPETAPAEPE